MNAGTLTGGVVREAVSAYTPSTSASASQRRVIFAVAVRDRHGHESVWTVEVEGDPSRLDLIEAEARPGRGVMLEYELATRPFLKHGVHTGEVRFLRAERVEFAPGRCAGLAEQLEGGADA